MRVFQWIPLIKTWEELKLKMIKEYRDVDALEVAIAKFRWFKQKDKSVKEYFKELEKIVLKMVRYGGTRQ